MSEQENLDRIMAHFGEDARIAPGKMFGRMCITVSGKAFAIFGKDGGSVAFKLRGEDHANALQIAGAQLFDPQGRGRPFKEWVEVDSAQADHWPQLAQQAHQYVLSLIS